MAGMLPGVELARRRRTHHHDGVLFARSAELSSLGHHHNKAPSSMDETALRARSRLERKLRCLPSRLNDKEKKEIRSSVSSTRINSDENHHPGMLKEVKPQLSTRKSKREICSICLDEFKAQQAVMNLPCSHRYHSDCLLPWLAAHSDCPYCRTAVPF